MMKLDARKIEMMIVRRGLSTSDVFRVSESEEPNRRIHRSVLPRIRKGKNVSIGTASNFCRLLDCDISEIIADED